MSRALYRSIGISYKIEPIKNVEDTKCSPIKENQKDAVTSPIEFDMNLGDKRFSSTSLFASSVTISSVQSSCTEYILSSSEELEMQKEIEHEN